MNYSRKNRGNVIAIVVSIVGLLVAVFAWLRTEGEVDIARIKGGSLTASVFQDSYPVALEFTKDQLTGSTLWFDFDQSKLVGGEVLGVQTERVAGEEEPSSSVASVIGSTTLLQMQVNGLQTQLDDLATPTTTIEGATTIFNALSLDANSVGSIEVIDFSLAASDLGSNSVGNLALQAASVTGDKIDPLTDLAVADARVDTLSADGVFFADASGNSGPNGEVVTILGDLYVSGSIDPTDILLEPLSDGAVAVDVRDMGGSVSVFAVDENGNVSNTGDSTTDGDVAVGNNLTVAGETTIGSDSVDTVTVNAGIASDLIPSVNEIFDLGSEPLRWRMLFVSVIDAAALISETLDVTGDSTLGGALDVAGTVTFSDILTVAEKTDLLAGLDVTGVTDLGSALNVEGVATLNSTLDVSGATTVGASLGVDGVTTLNDDLVVFGESFHYRPEHYYGDVDFGDGTNQFLRISSVDGVLTNPTTEGITIDDKFSVTGAVDFGSSLDVTGDTTLGRDLSVARDITVVGNTTLGIDANDLLQVDARSEFNAFAVFLADVEIYDDLFVSQDLRVIRDVDVDGALDVIGRLDTHGETSLGGKLYVSGDIQNGTLADANAVVINDKLDVKGTTQFSSTLSSDTGQLWILDDDGFHVENLATKVLFDVTSDGDVEIGNDFFAGVFSVNNSGSNGPETGVLPATTHEVSVAGDLEVSGVIDTVGILLKSENDGDSAIQVNDTSNTPVFTVDENGEVLIGGTIELGGGLNITGNLDVDGDTTLDALAVAEAATLSSTLGVTGAVAFDGNVALGDALADIINVRGRISNGSTAPVTVNDTQGFEVEKTGTNATVFSVDQDGNITVAGGATYDAASGTLAATAVEATTIQGDEGLFGQVDTTAAAETNTFAGLIDATKGLTISGETLTVGGSFTVTQAGAITAVSFTNGTILISGGIVSGVTTLGATILNATTVTATGTVSAATLTPTSTLDLTGGVTVTGSPTFSGAPIFSGNPSFTGNPTFTGSPTVAASPIISNATFPTEFAKHFVSNVQTASTGSGTVGTSPYVEFTIDVGAGETIASITVSAIGSDDVRAVLTASPTGNQTAVVRVFYPATSLATVITGITWTAELQ